MEDRNDYLVNFPVYLIIKSGMTRIDFYGKNPIVFEHLDFRGETFSQKKVFIEKNVK